MADHSIHPSDILAEANALVQAQNAVDSVDRSRPLAVDEATALSEAVGAMEQGVKDARTEKPLNGESDAQSLQQVINSKIIDEEEQIEENKVKSALIDALD